MTHFRKFCIGISTIIALPIVGLTSTTYYLYPELRNNKKQLHLACRRIVRVAQSGLRMCFIYLNQSTPIQQRHLKAAQVLKDAFLANSGLYIKMGQVIASLDLIVPDVYKATFEPLCNQCSQTPYKDVKQQIESSTQKDINDLFLEFDKQPISSASIAQVHRAVLKNGREVAVKVQHPWLKEQCQGDLNLMYAWICVGEKFFSSFQYKWLAHQLQYSIPKELDFIEEVKNAKRAKEMLKDLKSVKVPDVYEEYSNQSIIVMEYIHGIPLLNVQDLKQQKFNFKEIAQTISKAFTKLVFKNGFVHSDPHQGNIMIRRYKGIQQVVLLDHGLYTQLDEGFRYNYTLLWKAILEQDEITMKKAAIALGGQNDYQLLSAIVAQKPFEYIMQECEDTQTRLGRPTDSEELDSIVSQVMNNYPKIVKMISEVNDTMPMLFKVNDFLRTIDTKLGSPVNTFNITYSQVCDVMYELEGKDKGIIFKAIWKTKQMLNQMKLILLSLL